MKTDTETGKWMHLEHEDICASMICKGVKGSFVGKRAIVVKKTRVNVTVKFELQNGDYTVGNTSVQPHCFKFWITDNFKNSSCIPDQDTKQSINLHHKSKLPKLLREPNPHDGHARTQTSSIIVHNITMLKAVDNIRSLDDISEIGQKNIEQFRILIANFRELGLTDRTIRIITDIGLMEE